MTIPFFPTLPGQGWSVHKRPTFSTRVQSHVSGREVRNALYSYPLYEWELTFDALDSVGSYPGLNNSANPNSLQSLMGLYLACQGQFGTFVFVDPTDNLATNQLAYNSQPKNPNLTLGTVGETFIISRQFWAAAGTPPEPVGFVLSPSVGNGKYESPQIMVGGSVVPNSQYTIGPSAPGAGLSNVLTFTTAQTAGLPVEATFQFGFICRFSDDQNDFENFMNGLWKVDRLKFKSVRSQ